MEDNQAQSGRPDVRLFYDAFKATTIGIALENMEGRPLFANPALCAMFGFSEEEILSKHCVDFSPPEDAERDWALFERVRAGALKNYSLEKRFFRSDGSLFRGRLSISVLNTYSYPLVLATVEEIAQAKQEREIPQSQADLRKLTDHLIRVQEEERIAIARELRDGVNERLMLLSATLDHLHQNPPVSPDELRLKITEARQAVMSISQTVYTLSDSLHSWKLEYLGLVKAAASLCTEFANREHVEIEFTSANVPQELPSEISRSLFRLLKEALRIVTKNGLSRKLQVSFVVRSDELHLIIRDAAGGFDYEGIDAEDALNLTGLGMRLEMLSGELFVDSQSQMGTTLHARVPLLPPPPF